MGPSLWGWKGLGCLAALLVLSLLLWSLLLQAEQAQERQAASARFPALAWPGQLLPPPSGRTVSAHEGVDARALFSRGSREPLCQSGQVLLILVASAPGNTEARQVIRRTWGAPQGRPALYRWQAVFLVGQSPGAREAWQIQQEQRQFGDLLVGSYADTYRNLTLKVLHGLWWALERCRPSYVLKTDDDCFVNTDRLPEFLARKNLIRRGLYAGSAFPREKRKVVRQPSSKWYVSTDDYALDEYPPYASGIGYILSLDAVARVLWAAEHVRPIPVEDAFVGIVAQRAGLRLKSSARFAKQNLRWRLCNYRYLMVIHHLSGREQEEATESMRKAREACHGRREITRWK